MKLRAAALLLCLLALGRLTAATKPQTDIKTVDAVLLSDPHFDPFRDPGKVARLVSAPVDKWESIFREPASADAAEAFKKLQADCQENGADSEHDLLVSSFDAAAAASAKPAFVLVAGDLVAHRFDCRYRKLFPSDANVDEAARLFAEKTIDYVVEQLRQRFPSTPVYVALGNNDTGCADYRLDANSEFLRHTGESVAKGWPAGSEEERAQAIHDFARFGSYALTLPAPMRHTRLLVLDDLFLSADYKGNCSGSANAETGGDLLKWMGEQLAAAEKSGDNVWVLAHIPPGVNTYSTYLHGLDICHGVAPAPFLASQQTADLLADYASTLRVFISGHTHIDEMHLLGRDEHSPHRVALKTVPSISPISKNPPSFLTVTVDPVTATVMDYQLHTASASSGPKIRWSTAYDFRQAYGEPAYDAASLQDLFKRFTSPAEGDRSAAQTYQEHAASGLRRLAFQALWPQYVCAMRHESGPDFAACVCQSSQTAPPKP